MRELPVRGAERPALVDDGDFEIVSAKHWGLTRGAVVHYFVDPLSRKTRGVSLHRFILRPPSTLVVDHIDHDPLNNRRANLRLCKQRDNARNLRKRPGGTSRFKGVHFDARRGLWVASITVDYRTKFLGHYRDEVSAAHRYDEEAARRFGEYAFLNFRPTEVA